MEIQIYAQYFPSIWTVTEIWYTSKWGHANSAGATGLMPNH